MVIAHSASANVGTTVQITLNAYSSDNRRVSAGEVVAIVFTTIAGTVIIGLGVYFGIRWWKKRKARKEDEENAHSKMGV